MALPSKKMPTPPATSLWPQPRAPKRQQTARLAVILLAVGAASTVSAGENKAPPPQPKPPATTAQAAFLYEPRLDVVMYAKHADQRLFPASLTKIMTALLVLEQAELGDSVRVSVTAAGVPHASIGLKAGDVFTVEELLYGALIRSGNAASTALAEHVAGSEAAFVELMNARAKELGLTATHFQNSHGLHHPEHVSSARDMTRLAALAMQHDTFRRIVATRQKRILRPDGSAIELITTNRLLLPDSESYWKAADGIKTGYTRQAGRCLTASAVVHEWRLICTVLGSEDAWTDARRLLEWGYNNFNRRRVVTEGKTTASVHIEAGERPVLRAVAKEDVVCLVPRWLETPWPRVSEMLPEAPIVEGQEVGELVVAHPNGREERVSLIAAEAVPRSLVARLRDNLGSVTWGLIGVGLIAGALIHAAVTKAAGTGRRRQQKGM